MLCPRKVLVPSTCRAERDASLACWVAVGRGGWIRDEESGWGVGSCGWWAFFSLSLSFRPFLPLNRPWEKKSTRLHRERVISMGLGGGGGGNDISILLKGLVCASEELEFGSSFLVGKDEEGRMRRKK
jgi:hypothetical protein